MGALTVRQRSVLGGIAVATAIAGVLRYANAPAIPAFLVATVALAGMAWVVSFATEQVGARFGPAVTGVLQSSLGNLPEFFVVIFALKAGEKTVAETSILGSILVNALLVLGLVIVVGSRRAEDGVMRFRRRLPNDTATLLLVSSFIILLVALSRGSSDRASHHIKSISIIGSICLLAAYVAWLIPYLRSDQGGVEPIESREESRIPLTVSLVLLGVAGVGAAFVSDWFIHALTPTIDKIGVSDAFAGLVIVAIAGNAVENVVGLVLANKGQSDLAISIVKNSVAQIAAFLYPALILVSLLFSTTLTFAIAPVYVGALIGTAIVIWQITGDGEASAFEGWALVATFVILAAVALYE
jgi:Ca2+:H+ antiporter